VRQEKSVMGAQFIRMDDVCFDSIIHSQILLSVAAKHAFYKARNTVPESGVAGKWRGEKAVGGVTI
jgi:hypothetical protein